MGLPGRWRYQTICRSCPDRPRAPSVPAVRTQASVCARRLERVRCLVSRVVVVCCGLLASARQAWVRSLTRRRALRFSISGAWIWVQRRYTHTPLVCSLPSEGSSSFGNSCRPQPHCPFSGRNVSSPPVAPPLVEAQQPLHRLVHLCVCVCFPSLVCVRSSGRGLFLCICSVTDSWLFVLREIMSCDGDWRHRMDASPGKASFGDLDPLSSHWRRQYSSIALVPLTLLSIMRSVLLEPRVRSWSRAPAASLAPSVVCGSSFSEVAACVRLPSPQWEPVLALASSSPFGARRS